MARVQQLDTKAALPSQSQRVLVVAPQPFYQDRGTPICVRQVIEALGELGYKVDLLTYPIGENLPDGRTQVIRSSNPFGISHVPVGFSVRKLALDLTLVPRIRKLLRTGRYQAVHAVEEAAFPAAWWAHRLGIPMIYDMHSSMAEQMSDLRILRHRPGRAFLRRAERWLLERSTRVASSAGLAARVRELAPRAEVREWEFSSEFTSPDPNEVARLRENLDLAPGQRVVLYSGTFERYQGLRLLLEAVPLVLAREPDAVFVLVGVDGEQAAERIARIAEEVPGHRLRLVPRQPRSRIPAYFALADVLVSPRIFGGNLPLKVFDYLAAGRPIVATDIPSHRSVLNESRARLVKPAPEPLAAAIVSLLADPAEGSRLAAAGRAFAEERLAWNRFVRSVSELYQVIGPPGPRAVP